MHSPFGTTSQPSYYNLYHGRSRTALARLIPDPAHPTMYRVELPDGSISDRVNLARAKDAARSLAGGQHPELNRSLFRWRQDQSEAASAPRLCGFSAGPVSPQPKTSINSPISAVRDRPREKAGYPLHGRRPLPLIAIGEK